MDKPLAGITVLDLGQIYNGPYATFLLAASGARVIKVESQSGEALRGRGETSSAAYPFAMLNQGKESITLNLKSPEGIRLFKSMVKVADVVLENFSPDTMANLGLAPEVLQDINPGLIYASGSGYGRSGPHRDYLAMDITVQAMSGVMSTTGVEGMPPLKAGPAICDFFGGIHLHSAILTALLARERTGKGAILDVAMQDSVLPTLATVFGAYYYHDHTVPTRNGNKHPAGTMAPYNVYPTADGHIAIICIRDGHWRKLLQAIGREDLLDDERFATMADRAAAIDEVDAIVTRWSEPLTAAAALDKLQAAGVPASIVRNIADLMTDDHLFQRGMLYHADHPVLGGIVMANSPLAVAAGDAEPRPPAPELGESNEAVFGELLGMSPEEVERLRTEGVI